MKSIREIITKTLGLSLNEMTTTSNVGGTYKPPLRPGLRKWYKKDLEPYTEITSIYRDAELNYDMLDGHTKKTKKEINKKERTANYVAHKDYKQDSPVEGDDEYAPAGFKYLNHTDDLNESVVNEDLGVWFGTKKKPKGSKQPKGPWVNICKKVDGKHPPCGRPDATDRAYPKCRAAGVAGKMSDSQKKAACAQKRRAEKTNPKVGTGNKPKMVSYKPRKKNTNEEQLIKRLINKLK
jgi:hypothetical protein